MTSPSVSTQYFTAFEPPNPLQLEGGQTLGPITQAYESYGTLNEAKDNCILVCHALTGDAHAAFSSAEDESYIGWWDRFIGPEKAIDTTQHFVLCINVIGGCKGSTGPASLNPETNKPYGTDFPIITIADMVTAQKALIDHLGISTLKAVIGGSMGGMIALSWTAQYPENVRTCIPIAATGQVSPLAVAFDSVGRKAIRTDANYTDGHYYDQSTPTAGLSVARMIGHITYLSEQSMDKKFGRDLQDASGYHFHFGSEFQIESYLNYQGEKFVNRFDANSYVYLTKAVSYFDLANSYGSFDNAFRKSTARFLVIAITSDWLYTPKQSKAIVNSLMRLNKDVSYAEIDSYYGHDAFLIENDELNQALTVFIRGDQV
tara:strand:- start:2879 stop:4000 length:1122 start_codon:yes stop_codon:yes gene_type:complete